jgi:NAD(P)-dependent dehydrogenase (short-subunit alcohol dehydrogenase family)
MTGRGKDRFDLTGRVALITGASRGLGRAIATALAGAGARVGCVARSRESLDPIVAEISAAGGEALALPADVRAVSGLQGVVDRMVARWGRLDILVNNAGVGLATLAMDIGEEEWDLTIDTNLKSVFFLSQATARAMLRLAEERGATPGEVRGRIINVSSMMGSIGGNRRSVYCASKGGVDSLTRALAVEWARHPILVNAIAPGYFETDMTVLLKETPKFRDWVLERTPLRRWGSPDDLVGAVLFLSAPSSDYVTGTVLRVDGGWMANA